MRAVLAQPAFRNLWIGQTLSGVGDSMLLVVVALYVTDLTGSTGQVGLVLAAYSVPLVLFLLVGGVVADRLPRRGVMIASDAVRCAVHALLAVLIATGSVEVWHLVAIGVVFATADAFFRPAYTGLVPQTVPEELIQSARSAIGSAREVAFLAGVPLGTALYLALGPAWTFAVDAATFGVSIVFLLRVDVRRRGDPGERTTVLADLREGWSAVRSRAWVWATIAAFSVSLLTALGPYFTLGPTLAAEHYGEAGVFGAIQFAFGVGTVTGALWAGRWRPADPVTAGLLGASVWPASLLAFAFGVTEWALLAVTVVAGVGLGLFAVWWETALAERIPPHLLSRVSSYDWMGSLAFLPAGYLLSGVVGDAIGAEETLAAGGAIACVAMLAAIIPSRGPQ